ncbi:hypothetical protein IFM89_030581 [Coptis chinensis]|uniref:RNase H type-1 domain-containing protein n=1 Tax=Coptis chinensis TaxID=261450 RepID=A0A835LNY6_9MAGN|nr:hypothetical protein IFM89_030581 [Coptis chinensis]
MEVLFITINYPRSGQESRKHSLRLQPEVNGLLGMESAQDLQLFATPKTKIIEYGAKIPKASFPQNLLSKVSEELDQKLCKSAEENLTHLLWECSFSTQLWTWLAAGFLIQQPLPGFKEAILLSKSWSPMMKQIWNSGVVAAMVSLWNMRNKVYFESKVPNLMNCKQFVRAQIVCTHHRSKACNGNNNWETLVLTNWAVTPRPKQAPQLKTCVWIPPEPNIMKLNIDGAVFGSPGPSGIGICCRDSEGEFIFTFCKRLTNGTIDRAEAYAVVEGIEIAISRGFYHLWVESDSLSTVTSFSSGAIPWELQSRWKRCKQKITSIKVHSYMEGSQHISWIPLLKAGAALPVDDFLFFVGKLKMATQMGMPI